MATERQNQSAGDASSFERPIFHTPQITIHTLPDELWDRIVSDLDEPSLRSACLASRRFCRLAQPHLYRTCDLESDEYDQLKNKRFSRLLRTILRRSDLAAQVVSFSVGIECKSRDQHRTIATAQEIEGLRGRCRIHLANGMLKEYAIGILLTRLPNLGRLVIHVRQDRSLELLASVLHELRRSTCPSKPHFSRLRSIDVNYEDAFRTDWTEQDQEWADPMDWIGQDEGVPTLFGLSALQRFKISGIWMDATMPGWDHLARMSTVTNIEIGHESLLSASFLCQLVGACRQLKSFICHFRYPHDLLVVEPHSSLAKLLAALRLHVATLESFTLDLSGWRCFEASPLGSLHDFSQLKKIHLTEELLLRETTATQKGSELVQVLPPNVESLTLNHCQESTLMPQLERLLLVLPRRFPALKRVTIGDKFYIKIDNDLKADEFGLLDPPAELRRRGQLKSFRDKFRKLGIEFIAKGPYLVKS